MERKKRGPKDVSLTRSPAGVNLNIRVLKAFGNWGIEAGLLPEGNAFSKMRRLKVPVRSPRYLLQEEYTAIDSAEPSPLLRDVYLAALLTGVRLSDIVSLTWDAIDFNRRTITFRTSKTNMMHQMNLHPMLGERLLQRVLTELQCTNWIGLRGAGHISDLSIATPFLAAWATALASA